MNEDRVQHRVAIRFSDGVVSEIPVWSDETLVQAAIREKVPYAYQCLSGSCCSCQCHLLSGEMEMDSGVATSLLPGEHAAGLRLACVSRVSRNAEVTVDYPSTRGGPVRVNAFINRISWPASSVAELELELAEGDWLEFEPGQFVRLKVPGSDAWRSYSMSSTVDELPVLRLVIRCLESGVMSDYLRDRASVDDVLELEGPFGSFCWDPDLKRPHILIAGGTGIAPILSILDSMRGRSGTKPPTLLSFGCNDLNTLFYVEELGLRGHWMPRLELRVSVERGDPAGHRSGNPVQAVVDTDVRENTVAYLCGPPPMVAAASTHLLELGVSPENIHAEQFKPSEN
jgi:benzoate/toluate 1,2-dioxygenase reductase subunit